MTLKHKRSRKSTKVYTLNNVFILYKDYKTFIVLIVLIFSVTGGILI